jgi:hypothetical protein
MTRRFYRVVWLKFDATGSTDSLDLGDHEEIVDESLHDDDGEDEWMRVLIRVPQRADGGQS